MRIGAQRTNGFVNASPHRLIAISTQLHNAQSKQYYTPKLHIVHSHLYHYSSSYFVYIWSLVGTARLFPFPPNFWITTSILHMTISILQNFFLYRRKFVVPVKVVLIDCGECFPPDPLRIPAPVTRLNYDQLDRVSEEKKAAIHPCLLLMLIVSSALLHITMVIDSASWIHHPGTLKNLKMKP